MKAEEIFETLRKGELPPIFTSPPMPECQPAKTKIDCEYCSKDNFLVRIQDEVVYDFDDREYESHGTTWVTIIPRYCPLCGEKLKRNI